MVGDDHRQRRSDLLVTMRDYDRMVDEEKPIPVKVLGKTWQVPRSPRADHMAMLQRALLQERIFRAKVLTGKLDSVDLDAIDASMTDTISVAEVLAGSEIVAEWVAGGVRESQLKAIVADLWAEQQPEDSGKTEAGKRPPASSSSTGRSSKRTSPASTG